MPKSPFSIQDKIKNWFRNKGWEPFDFQEECWELINSGCHGLLNAPTGSGKTMALFLAEVIYQLSSGKTESGLKLIWITPLRALSADIQRAMQEASRELEIDWQIEVRTGDTDAARRKSQLQKMPDVLITTPESLHILFTTKNYRKHFEKLHLVVIDEWHELLGSKRGVHTELGLSHLKTISPELVVWGVSASIGNLDEANHILHGPGILNAKIVHARRQKSLHIETIMPDEVEKFPWAGHIGVTLLDKVHDIIKNSRTTLVFTNTRSQCEIWYQYLLSFYPELAGQMAIHHGSIDQELRTWVEKAIHEEQLKVVVCTSSLDLGVDFRPVETIIQVGSPKGVARFMQRAGRSGHNPFAKSTIYFVPTNSLEIIEGAAIKKAIEDKVFESRIPFIKPYDALIQYLLTRSLSGGFYPKELYEEIGNTFAYQELSLDEFNWILDFIRFGGICLSHYEEYKKVAIDSSGKYRIANRSFERRQRMSIGTIVGDISMKVKFQNGSTIGTIEESFIARFKPGDTFWFAGRNLELVSIKGLIAYVKAGKSGKGSIPRWMGGRMPLSSELSYYLRQEMHKASQLHFDNSELKKMKPLLLLQKKLSAVPSNGQLLIERIVSKEGHHIFFYPFEGRNVHEGMAALFAYRLSKTQEISVSMAMNDYGFELLSESEINLPEESLRSLFSIENLQRDLRSSMNATEMAKRRFRDIANIAGLVFTGYPGKEMKARHLNSSTSLLYDVLKEHEPDHPLLLQADEELTYFQFEEIRMRAALKRIGDSELIIRKVSRMSPFAFPIMVDRLREKMSNEKLVNRIEKLVKSLEKEV